MNPNLIVYRPPRFDEPPVQYQRIQEHRRAADLLAAFSTAAATFTVFLNLRPSVSVSTEALAVGGYRR